MKTNLTNVLLMGALIEAANKIPVFSIKDPRSEASKVFFSTREYAKVTFNRADKAWAYLTANKKNLNEPKVVKINASYSIYVDKKAA